MNSGDVEDWVSLLGPGVAIPLRGHRSSGLPAAVSRGYGWTLEVADMGVFWCSEGRAAAVSLHSYHLGSSLAGFGSFFFLVHPLCSVHWTMCVYMSL